ncbi:MAG: iron-sulfur cluster repair protein YtfE [Rhodospirillales bacterium]|nr:iron-sulfur cluster repair protein YtfE [Rhodospirillales bacterium]
MGADAPVRGFADRTLADIATALPGATALFRQHKLDFCCGGNVPLREAAAVRALDVPALEAGLDEVAARATPVATPADTDALIGLIETTYHAGHRAALPELQRLARRVEAVHKANPAVPAGLADLLAAMGEDLEAHMRKEEQVLFPLMRAGGHPMIGHPIAMMLAEHDDHGAHLRALEALTQDFTPPEGACTTWRALYAGLAQFTDALMAHIHLENAVLFPRFTG